MAGWILSKLKVVESLLQQIDQQAAESLSKNERSPSPSESPTSSAPNRSSSALPIKYQLPTKPLSLPYPPIGTPSLPDLDLDDRQWRKPAPDLPVTDGDWTELLGSPKTSNPLPIRTNRTPSPPRKFVVPSSWYARKGLRIAPVRLATRIQPLKEPTSPAADKGDTNVVAKKVRGGNTPDVNDQLRAVAVPGGEEGADDSTRVVEAIKERENIVARLEGEKQSLETILEEAQRQQAQEHGPSPIVHSEHDETPTIVDLDCEWKPNQDPWHTNKVATLQLCIVNKCIIIQFFYMDHVPQALKSFMNDNNYTFVGIMVDGDIAKLELKLVN